MQALLLRADQASIRLQALVQRVFFVQGQLVFVHRIYAGPVAHLDRECVAVKTTNVKTSYKTNIVERHFFFVFSLLCADFSKTRPFINPHS